MNVREFYALVDAQEDLLGHGIGDDGTFLVEYLTDGILSVIGIQAVEDNNWATIYDVFAGRREPSVLYGISRVCGYYSRIDNWNDSKKGELLDRHKGNYNVNE